MQNNDVPPRESNEFTLRRTDLPACTNGGNGAKLPLEAEFAINVAQEGSTLCAGKCFDLRHAAASA